MAGSLVREKSVIEDIVDAHLVGDVVKLALIHPHDYTRKPAIVKARNKRDEPFVGRRLNLALCFRQKV
jgi:hypothetical protein